MCRSRTFIDRGAVHVKTAHTAFPEQRRPAHYFQVGRLWRREALRVYIMCSKKPGGADENETDTLLVHVGRVTGFNRSDAESVCRAGQQPGITVRWGEVIRVSKATPTLQVVVNPPLRRGTKIHDRVFQLYRTLDVTMSATSLAAVSQAGRGGTRTTPRRETFWISRSLTHDRRLYECHPGALRHLEFSAPFPSGCTRPHSQCPIPPIRTRRFGTTSKERSFAIPA